MELLRSAGHPEEIVALINFKMGKCSTVKAKICMSELTPTMQRCYDYLNKTSRSFSAVIQALDGELRHAVCIFYLVLRALDTVEDDMSIPIDKKVSMLRAFYSYLYDADWKYLDSTEKDKVVLEDFMTISHEFRTLSPMYQGVIADITKQMGNGMTVFFERELNTEEEWDEYCHYVAGLVGIGLSKLFSASGLEDSIVGKDTALANSMGLFLQKTNIIRDYLEDINEGRIFWPKSTWSKYAQKLTDFKAPENGTRAVSCLNDLVTNALSHVPDVMEYMSRLKNQSVFNFCAIPQVMAIATLERLYSNPMVFEGAVKIRKGQAVRMMFEATNVEKIKAIMRLYLREIEAKISKIDPSHDRTVVAVKNGLACTETSHKYHTTDIYVPLYMSVLLMIAAIVWHYWNLVSSMMSNDKT